MPTHSPPGCDTVTILGGGLVNHRLLERALAIAPRLVAADGGADAALAVGRMPEAVIGDFDSISEAAQSAIPAARQHRVTEQESTDFEKCLRLIEAPLVVGLGFLGPRFDHALAALNTLARFPDRRCVLASEEDVCFMCPPALDLDLPRGMRLSLFPVAPVRGESEGLRWPIGGIAFAPAGRIGTSNEVTGPVRLRMASAGMAAILPVSALETVVEALMAEAVADG